MHGSRKIVAACFGGKSSPEMRLQGDPWGQSPDSLGPVTALNIFFICSDISRNYQTCLWKWHKVNLDLPKLQLRSCHWIVTGSSSFIKSTAEFSPWLSVPSPNNYPIWSSIHHTDSNKSGLLVSPWDSPYLFYFVVFVHVVWQILLTTVLLLTLVFVEYLLWARYHVTTVPALSYFILITICEVRTQSCCLLA